VRVLRVMRVDVDWENRDDDKKKQNGKREKTSKVHER